MEPHKAGYLDINGIQLYHEIYGEGKPVVLVHGGIFYKIRFSGSH